MGEIISDFSNVLPFLNGKTFEANLCIPYRVGEAVRYRNDVLVDLCRGKRVLHVGCCDHVPLIRGKRDRGDWLHQQITECSADTVGIDIDAEAVAAATRISGLTNMYAGDITSEDLIAATQGRQFDIALFGEVVEHISNPAAFLRRFRENYGATVRQLVITVPNAFRAGNIRGALKGFETINSDHRYFFTPYTIAKVALDAGFDPVSISLATYTRAGAFKTMVLNRWPMLAEDIIYIGRPMP